VGELVAMSYSSCIASQMLCVFSKVSTKCSECVQKGVAYDGNFFINAFDKLIVERY
jgi:hypothetical protein